MNNFIIHKFGFLLGTTIAAADILHFATGFFALLGAIFMAISGYYSMRLKRQAVLREIDTKALLGVQAIPKDQPDAQTPGTGDKE